MGNFKPEKIRNICFAGHGRSGKTTLCEAMLYYSGSIDRFGSVADGTSVMDYDPEEIKRNFSTRKFCRVVFFERRSLKCSCTSGIAQFDFVTRSYVARHFVTPSVAIRSCKNKFPI